MLDIGLGGQVRGRISTMIVVPLLVMACAICAGIFFTGATTSSGGTPAPYSANQTFIGNNFFSNLDGWVANINSLGAALKRITPTTGPQFTDLTAYVDTGVAIIRIFLGIPVLMGSFLYDLVHIVLFFIPASAPSEFLGVLGILIMIPIVYLLFEIASAIRSPSVGKW